MTDAFTKMAQLAVLKDKEANTVADAILHHWIFVFGIPRATVQDQGLEFQARVWKDICQKLEITHISTSGYHPQTNSQAEVFNRSMGAYLRKMVDQANRAKTEWELFIGPLQLAYNTAVHKATGKTPFAVLLGYNPRTPLWPEGELVLQEEEAPADEHEAIANLRRAQLITRAEAADNNVKFREDYETSHNRKFRAKDVRPLRVGDTVWVSNDRASLGPNPKLRPLWEEGTIEGIISDSVVRVSRPGRKRKKLSNVNIERIRPRRV
jgi:hypothetical protein